MRYTIGMQAIRSRTETRPMPTPAFLMAMLASLMGASSILFTTAAGSGIDRYPGASRAMLAHAGASALGSGVIMVMAIRTAAKRREA